MRKKGETIKSETCDTIDSFRDLCQFTIGNGKTTGKITGITTGKSGEWPDERCLIIRTKDGEREEKRGKSVWRSSNVVLFGLIRRSSYAHPPPIQFALTRKTNQAVGME